MERATLFHSGMEIFLDSSKTWSESGIFRHLLSVPISLHNYILEDDRGSRIVRDKILENEGGDWKLEIPETIRKRFDVRREYVDEFRGLGVKWKKNRRKLLPWISPPNRRERENSILFSRIDRFATIWYRRWRTHCEELGRNIETISMYLCRWPMHCAVMEWVIA